MKLLEKLEPKDVDEILLRLCKDSEAVVSMGKDQWGCCVLKACIDKATPESPQHKLMVDAVVDHTLELVILINIIVLSWFCAFNRIFFWRNSKPSPLQWLILKNPQVQDPYGNYVVQHILASPLTDDAVMGVVIAAYIVNLSSLVNRNFFCYTIAVCLWEVLYYLQQCGEIGEKKW